MAQGPDNNSSDSSHDSAPPPRLRGPPPGATEPPAHVKKPQVYEIFHGVSDNHQQQTGPDGHPQTTSTTTTAPNASPPTIKDGFRSIKADDFLNVHRIPCARQGFLTGIGAGAVMGMGRYIFGARIPKAANWAFATFLAGSVVQFEVCQAARRREQAAVARAVEIIDQKKAERAARQRDAVAAARRRREQEEEARGAKKSWYRFW